MIKDLLKQDKVIILFSAPFCASCPLAHEIIDSILKDFDDIYYVKLNITEPEVQQFARSIGVATLPNAVFFHAGKPVLNMIGKKFKLQYESKIKWLNSL